MRSDIVKSTVFIIVANLIEIILFLLGVHISPDFTGIALLFPIAVLLFSHGLFAKDKLQNRLFVLIFNMIALFSIQNVIAYLFGDDGARVAVLFVSFLITLIPFALYAAIAAVVYMLKHKARKN